MRKSNLFYSCYDMLFSNKNYSEEVDRIMSIFKDNGIVVNNILEIGCGTGNHTIELTKKISSVHAINIDEEMVRIAQKKTKDIENVCVQKINIEEFSTYKFEVIKAIFSIIKRITSFPKLMFFFKGYSITPKADQEFSSHGFDGAVAMFDVITYIPSIQKLVSFFKGVSKTLKPGGVFIFDGWNGVAALKFPPTFKSSVFYNDNKKIICEVRTIPHLFRQKVTLQYEINIYENEIKLVNSDVFSIDQRLWTFMEINCCLEEAGLQFIKCTQIPPNEPSTESDWKMMFICKKQD